MLRMKWQIKLSTENALHRFGRSASLKSSALSYCIISNSSGDGARATPRRLPCSREADICTLALWMLLVRVILRLTAFEFRCCRGISARVPPRRHIVFASLFASIHFRPIVDSRRLQVVFAFEGAHFGIASPRAPSSPPLRRSSRRRAEKNFCKVMRS